MLKNKKTRIYIIVIISILCSSFCFFKLGGLRFIFYSDEACAYATVSLSKHLDNNNFLKRHLGKKVDNTYTKKIFPYLAIITKKELSEKFGKNADNLWIRLHETGFIDKNGVITKKILTAKNFRGVQQLKKYPLKLKTKLYHILKLSYDRAFNYKGGPFKSADGSNVAELAIYSYLSNKMFRGKTAIDVFWLPVYALLLGFFLPFIVGMYIFVFRKKRSKAEQTTTKPIMRQEIKKEEIQNKKTEDNQQKPLEEEPQENRFKQEKKDKKTAVEAKENTEIQANGNIKIKKEENKTEEKKLFSNDFY